MQALLEQYSSSLQLPPRHQASSVFSISEKKCSLGFSLDTQESQITVVIAVGMLLVPFSLSSVLALIHSKWANLLTAIGFALIIITAFVIVASLDL